MKKISSAIVAVACFGFFLQGCLKDTYEKTYTYTYYKPVYKTTAEVRANIKSSSPRPIERPGKIYIRGSYIFLNDIDKGIHVIDNSNPASPVVTAFINIPGNMDMAVQGNTLYADLYTDLVALDIANPEHVILKKLVEGVFSHRYFGGSLVPDSTKVIAAWEKKDTTIKEKHQVDEWLKRGAVFFDLAAFSSGPASGNAAVSSSPYGVGGSMARFAIAAQRLYTVGTADLQVFNITNANDPFNVAQKAMWDIETIFPFRDKLFIGSQSGMFIYNISNPDNPVQEAQFAHARSCDPVVSDGNYAYVTLRSGTSCLGFSNQLDVLNLANIFSPVLVKSYTMTNPHGLSKEGNILFVCDGKAGLKIYDAANVSDLKPVTSIANIEAYDVIAYNGNALVVANDGLYQYDYSDLKNVHLRSKIAISK
jgi:hypothetical protein